MKRLILSGWAFIVCAIILVAIFGAEFGINRVIKDGQDGVEVVCNPMQLVVDNNKFLQLEMDCNGKVFRLGATDAEQIAAIASAMNDPERPLACKRYATGRVVCQP